MKKNRIILILLICLLSVSTAYANEIADNNQVNEVNNENIYVSTTGSDANTGTSSSNPFASIEKAVNASSDNSTIYLGEGTFTGEKNSGITINKNNTGKGTITLIGAGIDKTIIDLNGSQLFKIEEKSSISLINLTIKNGYGEKGGAIYSYGILSIDNVKFLNNSANYGGAIYIGSSGKIDINNSCFINNTGEFMGGAISSDAIVNVYNSEFDGNKATYSSSYGGTLNIGGSSIIENNKFKNSVAATYGGAIYVSDAIISNNLFENCSITSKDYTYYGGGAICGSKGSLTLFNNTMINCKAANGMGNKIKVVGKVNAIVSVLNNSTLDITSSTFSLYATVTDDMGNRIHGDACKFYFNNTELGFASCVDGLVEGEFSKLFDNGLYIVSVKEGFLSPDATLKNGTVNYQVPRDNIDIYVSPDGNDSNNGSKDNPVKTIEKAFELGFKNNIFVNIHLLEGTFNLGNITLNKVGYLNISGVHNKTIIKGNKTNSGFDFGLSLNVNINNITFTNFTRTDYKGVISAGYDDHNINTHINININDCVFEKCNVYNLIDVMSHYSSVYSGNLNNILIINCAAGIIGNLKNIDNLTIINSSISKIHASNILNSNFINITSTSSEGFIYVFDSLKTINNKFIDIEGIVIYTYHGATLVSINDTFINVNSAKKAAVNGGGTFINASFENCTSDKYAGAIYVQWDVLTLINCTFKNNNGPLGNGIYGDVSRFNGELFNPVLNISNSLIFEDVNNVHMRAVLTAKLVCDYPVSGYLVNFYLNGTFVGSAPLINNIATFTAAGFKNGIYNISGSVVAINQTKVISGTLNLNVSLSNLSDVYEVYVSENGSDTAGDGSFNNPFATIKKAYDVAMTKDALSIKLFIIGTLKGKGNVKLDLNPDVDITIIGFNKDTSIINAEKNDCIINFKPYSDNVKVYIKNLTIMNGFNSRFSIIGSVGLPNIGLFKINGLFMSVDNCKFVNAQIYGVYVNRKYSTLIVNNTEFIKSFAICSNGAARDIIISNSKILNNTFSKKSHIIYIRDIFSPNSFIPEYNITQVTLDNLTFYNNKLKSSYSLIYLDGGTITNINNCSFINTMDGGAVYGYPRQNDNWTVGIISINDCYFENNSWDIYYNYMSGNIATGIRPIFNIFNTTFNVSGGFTYPDPRYTSPIWNIKDSAFINMKKNITLTGSKGNTQVYDDNLVKVVNTLFINTNITLHSSNISGSAFYNSLITLDTKYAYVVYLDNNFWNGTPKINNPNNNPNVYCDWWIAPGLTTNDATGPVQEITLSYMLFNGTNYKKYDASKVPIFDVNSTLSVSGGSINPNDGVLTNKNEIVSEFTYNGLGNQTVFTILDNGMKANLTVVFHKLKTDLDITLNTNNINIGDNLVVNIKLADKDDNPISGNVSVYLNSALKESVFVNGSLNLVIPINFNAGPYEVFAQYDGDDYHVASDATSIITVKSTTMDVTVDNKGSTSNTLFNITMNFPANGTVTASINNVSYNTTLVNGKGTVVVPAMDVGNYTALVSYNGIVNKTVSYNNAYVKSNNTDIIADNIVKYYKNGTDLIGQLVDSEGVSVSNQTVYITLNNVTYKRTTNSTGKFKMPINLNPGNYPVLLEYRGNKLNPTSKMINITVLSILKAEDIELIFRNGTKFTVTLLDDKGKVLPNTKVTFNINGVFYTRTSNDKGVAGLNINLNPGKYVITSEYKGCMISNNITVYPTLTDNNDLVKYYRNGSQFTVKVLDKYGKAMPNAKVTFNINGVFYTRTSNSEGVATLNINLGPGEYIITSINGECSVANKIKVLSVIETENIEMTTDNRKQFVAKVLDAHGKPLAKASLAFNINGVLYNRITDADGLAKLNINLMAGEYIITTMYNGLSVGNTVTVKQI